MSSRVLVLSGGAEIVWRKIMIRKSLDEICHYMELDIPVSERSKVHKHSRVEVRFQNQYIRDSGNAGGGQKGNGRLVTTVLLDEITDTVDSSSKYLTAVGRSPARDIIDSTWSSTISGRPTLETVVKTIADKFNIPLARFGPVTGAVPSFSFENESPWTKLLTEAQNQGFIFTSSEAGGLYLWPVASTPRREGFNLTEGKNIRTIQTTENGAEQFHTYVVKGGGKSSTLTDSSCSNNRILTIVLTGSNVSQTTLDRRARTELYRRRENKTTVNVSGWGLTDRQIQALGEITKEKEVFWNPNFLIPVNIPSSGLNDILLLTSQVEYHADVSSMTCDLTLTNKEAYL